MYNFVPDYLTASQEELEFFYKYVLPPLDYGESYFLNLAYRPKGLTPEQRVQLGVGASEMLKCEVLSLRNAGKPTLEQFKGFCRRFNVDEKSLLTKTDKEFPRSGFVVYMLCNPSSELKVAKVVRNRVNELTDELANAALKHSQDGVNVELQKLSTLTKFVKTAHADCMGTRHYVDFDVDVLRDYYVPNYDKFHDVLLEEFKAGNFVMVASTGGFHVLVKTSALNSGNMHNAPTKLKALVDASGNTEHSEVKNNKQCLFPLPGSVKTVGNEDFLVTVMNKEDFE